MTDPHVPYARELPYTQLDPQAIVNGALDEIDLLVASGAGSSRGLVLLRRRGVRNLVDWVNGGGRYVGFRGGGARLAALIGLSTANLHFPLAEVPGSLIGRACRRRARSPTASAGSSGCCSTTI